MPSVSDESRAAADLTSSELAAAGDGDSEGSGAGPTPEGSTSELLHSSGNGGGGKPTVSQPAPGEIVGTDEGDQKEAIISILEDWAAWERTLEEEGEAEKTDGVTTDTDTDEQPLVEALLAVPAASLSDDNAGVQPHINGSNNSSKNCAVAESVDKSPPTVNLEPTLKRNSVSASDSNQLLYASRRERRRAERHDPVARARRQALKVWAADQTRRRSSAAEENSVSESLRRQGAGSLKEWAAMNSRSSRRSSGDVTVDHNRKGVGGPSDNEWFRRKKLLPPRVPRQVSIQRKVRNIVELGLEPGRPPRLAAAEQPKQQALAHGKAGQRRLKSSHPWRANMKPPQERGGRSAFGIAREGKAPTAPPSTTPRSSAAVLSSPSSASSMVAGRGSPWARSPSRETAGGILVNHCFFYGSSGRATSPKAVAATTSPSFESAWMRQFREEVSSNPNWWLGSDRFSLGRVAASRPGNLRGGRKGSSGRPARCTTSTLTTRGKGSRDDRTTDLWQEVRSLLAAGRHGGATAVVGGESGREHDDSGAADTPCGGDLLSFGDRLRYTPLSQGAWLLGRAAAAAAAAEQRPDDVGSHSEEGGLTIAATEVVGVAAAAVIEVKGNEKEKEAGVVDDAVSGQTPAGGESSLKGKGGEQSTISVKASDGGGRRLSNRQDLQSIHAATLAKLRGEIDPFTREELVLRAAEEARGALARERARSTSPRRASAGICRPSSRGTRRGVVPDSIDYDKVEATLSLIELATRAAGPDAGSQMLQALEGLDKMHQRVSEEKITTGEERAGFRGEQGSVTSPQEEVCPIAPVDKRSERNGSGVSSDTAGNVPATADGDRIPDAAVKEENGVTASPRRLSRKYSLAVSSSSEESAAGSEASSVGMIQTIGNWLWSTTPPILSRRNSQSSDVEAADGNESGHESGLSQFPSPPKGSDAEVSEPLEANDASDRTVSDEKQGDYDATAQLGAGRGGTSSQQGCEETATDKPSRLLDPAAENSAAEGPTSDDTGNEQRGSGCQAEEGASDTATGMTGGKESTSGKQAARGDIPIGSPRLKARRSSEADKPSGFPQLAKETAPAEEPISDAVDLPREASRNCSEDEKPSNSEAPAPVESADGKEQSISEAPRTSELSSVGATAAANKDVAAALPGMAASDGEQKRMSTGRSGVTDGTEAADHTATPLSPEGFDAKHGGDPTDESCRLDIEPETSEEDVLRVVAPGATGCCSKGSAEGLGHRAAATANGDTPVVGAGDNRDEDLGTSPASPPLPHRDSWFSVGSRPRRGNSAKQEQTSASKPSAADAQTSGGRGEMSSQGIRSIGVVDAGRDFLTLPNRNRDRNRKRDTKQRNGSPGRRWVSPTVCFKFVWPKPGQVCSPKRLLPPGPSGKDNMDVAPPLPSPPGIVRRSPLIDALHPEVARQRQFQLQLRQARQRESPPRFEKPQDEGIDKAAGLLSEAAAANSREAEKTANRAAATLVTIGAASTNAASGVRGTAGKSPHATATAAPSTVHVHAATTGGVKAHHPRRPRRSETEPLPVPPPRATEPSRPLVSPTGSGAAAGASRDGPTSCGFSDAADAVARAGRLGALQWECVGAWMARTRRSLGPKVWACLGSTNAFHRTRNRIRQSIGVVSGDDEHRALVTRGDRPPPTDDAGSPHPGRSAGAGQQGVPGGGRRAKERQEGGAAKPSLHQARKRGALKGDRAPKEAKDEAKDEAKEEDAKAEEQAFAGSWDQHLSEKAALAINAVMWTIATERERTACCATFARDSAVNGLEGGENSPAANATARQQAPRGTETYSNPAATTTAVLELRVSLAAARRFIKSSRLIDGFFVLDADVDLAFKRWEDVGRLTGRDQHGSLGTGIATGRSPTRRGAKGTVEASFTDASAAVLLTQKLCEAVGCSDPALYGDIHPLAKARLCRKHRRNGMVDVGNRRCERPDCGRLAVGASTSTSTNASTSAGALCTLHAREGRVDVEGLTDVLLELSKARHTRIRRLETGAAAAANSEGQALSTSSRGLAARDPAVLALDAAAVRNVLLAVTNQPLVPGSASAGPQLSPAAAQGSARFSPGDNAAAGPGNHAPTWTSTSTSTSTGSVRRRPVAGRPATPEAAVSATAAASEQRQRRGSRRGASNSDGADEKGIGFGVLETVGRVYRRSSAAVASAVLGAPPALAESSSGGEREDGHLGSHRQGKRGQSFLSRRESGREEEEGKAGRRGERVGLIDGAGASSDEEEVLDCRARRSKSRLGRGLQGSDGGGGGEGEGDGVDLHDDQQAQRHEEGPLQSRSFHDTTQSRGVAIGARSRSSRDETRRRGVNEVLAENSTSLQAMFLKFSRQSADGIRGATMTLPDILRFCDAFELRPGLVSTREIVDAYKEVAYPGGVGLTDEAVGFSSTKQVLGNPNSACKRKSERPLAPGERRPQDTPSSASTSGHGDPAGDPTFHEGKGNGEPLALADAAFGNTDLNKFAASRDMTLEDLAKTTDVAELAERQGADPSGNSREHTEGGARTRTEQEEDGGRTQELPGGDTRRDSGETRGIGQKENSTRWDWSRRGTDECSLYFRSDSPSRRTSTASNSGVGGKGKRTVYLGRIQAFPLRRVESSLAVDARGFGLSGVAADAIGGGSRRRRSSNLESPKSQRNAPSRRRSVACDGKGDGDLTSSAEAPGLTEPKFFDWLSQVAVECKALTTKNTFGHSLRRSPSKRGNPGRNLRGKAESGHSIQGGSSAMESGVNGAASARRNAARAVVLLQWMEVSRGMKSKKTGDIPPFRLSSCLVNGKRLS